MMQTNQNSVSSIEAHIEDLNERFSRLIKQLGASNKKGTLRYNFEVDFMYSLHEVKNSPTYLQGKMFDKANAVVTALGNLLKLQRDSAARREA